MFTVGTVHQLPMIYYSITNEINTPITNHTAYSKMDPRLFWNSTKMGNKQRKLDINANAVWYVFDFDAAAREFVENTAFAELQRGEFVSKRACTGPSSRVQQSKIWTAGMCLCFWNTNNKYQCQKSQQITYSMDCMKMKPSPRIFECPPTPTATSSSLN